MLKLFKKHAAVIAALSLFGGSAWAQTTVLGPNMTTVTVGTAAVLAALPSNPARRAVTVCNGAAATNILTMTTGTLTPVAGTTGIVMPPGNLTTSCFTIGNPIGPIGGVGAQVNLIASAASTPVTIIEYY